MVSKNNIENFRFFLFSSRRRHTRYWRDWSSDVCSSKIESGMMAIDVGELAFADVVERLDRSFRQVADDKNLEFVIEQAEGLGRSMRTDEKRLQQVLKNLLSNAFKFTESGRVTLRIEPVAARGRFQHEALNRAEEVIAFSVIDTGIGIAPDKQRIIFEAFQQADGTTSRKYGGTGLGLNISREIARLLGGEIRAESTVGEGSTFTLFLPENFTPVEPFGAEEELPVPSLPADLRSEER